MRKLNLGQMNIYSTLLRDSEQNKKNFAVLVDPDKPSDKEIVRLVEKKSIDAKVDFFFVGGSLLMNNNLDHCIKLLKENSENPGCPFSWQYPPDEQ